MTTWDSIAIFAGCGIFNFIFSLLVFLKTEDSILERVFLFSTIISGVVTFFITIICSANSEGPIFISPRVIYFWTIPIGTFLIIKVTQIKDIVIDWNFKRVERLKKALEERDIEFKALEADYKRLLNTSLSIEELRDKINKYKQNSLTVNNNHSIKLHL